MLRPICLHARFATAEKPRPAVGPGLQVAGAAFFPGPEDWSTNRTDRRPVQVFEGFL